MRTAKPKQINFVIERIDDINGVAKFVEVTVSGDEESGYSTLKWMRQNNPGRRYRLIKTTTEVIDQ